MTKQEVFKMATELMVENNSGVDLLTERWYFEFIKTKKAIGRCNYRLKAIQYSIHFLNESPESIKDTILHEIAHALTPGAGHGPKWRIMARKLGIKPERCSKVSAESREHLATVSKYKAVCVGCGEVHSAYRLRKHSASCSKCSGGRYNPAFKLNYVAQR